MSIWRKLLGFFRRGAGAAYPTSGAAPSLPRTGGVYSPFSALTGSGGTAMSVATVFRCVQLLGDSVANLPMLFLRKKGEIFTSDETSRLHYLLTVQPDMAKSAFMFWKELVERVLLEGNAYVVPVYNASSLEIDRLVLCGRGTVFHDIYTDYYTVNDTVNGISGKFHEDEIIHVMRHTFDGKHGVSVLEYARRTLDIAYTGDSETLGRFANGGDVRGIVSNDKTTTGFGEYQDAELEKTAENIDDRFHRGERIVSLPGQVEFKQKSLSSVDMQFLESRKFTVREICRFFGVHPSYVFDDTSNNYKSAEMANVAFLSTTLNPLLRNIENEFLRKLVAPSLCAKRKFQFDREGLYACDLDSRVRYQTSTIAAGLYTVNDWRRKENRPSVEGGDKVFVSANLKGINEDDAKTMEE